MLDTFGILRHELFIYVIIRNGNEYVNKSPVAPFSIMD